MDVVLAAGMAADDGVAGTGLVAVVGIAGKGLAVGSAGKDPVAADVADKDPVVAGIAGNVGKDLVAAAGRGLVLPHNLATARHNCLGLAALSCSLSSYRLWLSSHHPWQPWETLPSPGV